MTKVPTPHDQGDAPRGEESEPPDVSGWSSTLQRCMILLAERMPAVAAVMMWLASRR